MYHPQCEILMPHEALQATSMELGGPSHLTAAAVAMPYSDLALSTAAANAVTIPGELNFHLHHATNFLHSLDVPAAPTPSQLATPGAADYFVGEPVQFDQLPPHHQMAMMNEYYHSVQPSEQSYLHGSRSGSLVFGVDESTYMSQFESSQQVAAGSSSKRRSMRGGSHGSNGVEKKEKQRRQRLSEKYTALMLLIPNRTKEDRATVISDAIDYIRELGRTVDELTLLVEKKRRRKELQGDVVDAPPAVAVAGDVVESSSATAKHFTDAEENTAVVQQLRSTYIQRKSKETFVDVRIVEDEVNIKLTKRRRDGCLVAASRALDELRLELVHVSGGKIGDYHIYMFNTKIHQGSSVFASAVATKLIEVVDE